MQHKLISVAETKSKKTNLIRRTVLSGILSLGLLAGGHLGYQACINTFNRRYESFTPVELELVRQKNKEPALLEKMLSKQNMTAENFNQLNARYNNFIQSNLLLFGLGILSLFSKGLSLPLIIIMLGSTVYSVYRESLLYIIKHAQRDLFLKLRDEQQFDKDFVLNYLNKHPLAKRKLQTRSYFLLKSIYPHVDFSSIYHDELPLDTVDFLLQQCANLEIDYPERFKTSKELQQILKERCRVFLNQSNKSVALLFFSACDHNGAFASQNLIGDILKHNYQTFYYETSTVQDMCEAVVKTDLFSGERKDIRLIVFAGHGTENSIQLSPSQSLDINNNNNLIFAQFLNHHCADDAVIILDSCSTGSGKTQTFNMANFLTIVLGKKRLVYSPTKTTSKIKIVFDKNNKIKTVKYSESGTYTATFESISRIAKEKEN